MSYRPEEQELAPSLAKITEGVTEFRAAVVKRIKSHDWKDSHLQTINKLSLELLAYEKQLLELEENNW